MDRCERKRTRSNPGSRSRITRRDLDVLAGIVWAGILSTSQVERLYFPSRRRAQRRLRVLLDHELARAHLQAGALERENVYTVSPHGLDRLVESGHFDHEARPKLTRLPRVSKLAHALAVREVFVAALLWERGSEGRHVEVIFEGDLAGDETLKSVGVIPDALVTLTAGSQRTLVYVEVDLGTETSATLGKKLERWRELRHHLGTGGTKLLFLAERKGRLRTIERLASDIGVPLGTALISETSAALEIESPQPPAAPPRQTERPLRSAKHGGFRPVD